MDIRKVLFRVLFTSGVYAVLCIPSTVMAVHFRWPIGLYDLVSTTQQIAILLCFVSSALFIWLTRGTGFGSQRTFALVVFILSGLWVGFLACAIVVGGIGFDLPNQ